VLNSAFLKLYKKSWATPLQNPLTAESRIFFSIWINDSAIEEQKILYKIHAFKLRYLKGKSSNTIQLSMDIVNFGNMLNSEWGVRKYATTSGYFQPLSVTLAGSTPTYQFDPTPPRTFVASPDLFSRWQIQFGTRYIF
jgi:hypothetical protein